MCAFTPSNQVASPAVRAFLEAVRLADADHLARLFSADAIVNDDLEEHVDRASIRSWIESAIIGAQLAIFPLEVDERGDRIRVRASLEGRFDRRGLPDPLIVTFYFTTRDDTITQLIILRNVSDL